MEVEILDATMEGQGTSDTVISAGGGSSSCGDDAPTITTATDEDLLPMDTAGSDDHQEMSTSHADSEPLRDQISVPTSSPSPPQQQQQTELNDSNIENSTPNILENFLEHGDDDEQGVEIITVMPEDVQHEETEHDSEQESEHPTSTSTEQQSQPTETLSDNLEELSLIKETSENVTENELSHNNEQQGEQQSSSPNREITENILISEPVVESHENSNEPIVETVEFSLYNSGDILPEDESSDKVSHPGDTEESHDVDEGDDHDEEFLDHPTTSISTTTTDANTIVDSLESSKDEATTEAVAASEATPTAASGSVVVVVEAQIGSGDLFKDVKFAVCEDLNDMEKIKKVLTLNGAKFLNYLSDSATHMIADNPDHLSVSEAVDIYEKPVVTSQWVWLSLRSNKILPIAPFSPFRNRLFSSVIACPSRLQSTDCKSIWSMITYHGGHFQTSLDSNCTHLITTSISGAKYDQVISQQKLKPPKCCKIVTPDWVVDSIRKKALCDEERYHPRLLITYNAGKQIQERKVKEEQESTKNASDITDDSVFTRTTKSVTLTISTEAVVGRKADPAIAEQLAELNSQLTSPNQTSNVQIHSTHSVPNSSISSSSSLLASTPSVRPPPHHPQQQQHFHQLNLQQSKSVQLNLSGQSNYHAFRHQSPAAQVGNVAATEPPQPQARKQSPKQAGQVHAVKSRSQTPKASQGKQTAKAKQQQQQQQPQSQAHLSQESSAMETAPVMHQTLHPVGTPSGYHHGQMMPQQQHQPQQIQQPPQMVNNQELQAQQYRQQQQQQQQTHHYAGMATQPQMGNLNQQPQPMHPQQQQQQQTRQVYLTLQQQQQLSQQQQQQQMQFVNGQPQFIRPPFVARPQQQQQMPQHQQQQQQHQQQHLQQMGPGVMQPAQQQMYRHPVQFQQQMQTQMQQQRQMQPMQYVGQQGQMPQPGGQQQQLYMNQHPQQTNMGPGQMQRLPMQQQQQQPQMQQAQLAQQMGQQTVNSQQGIMNQNQQYNQMQQVTPQQEVPVSMGPGNMPQQYQQQGPIRMPMNMAQLRSLPPEQQQQILMQQHKLQQAANFQQQNMQQQTPIAQQQQPQQMIRPLTPQTPGHQSPQSPMLSPTGTPVQQRMMMRPTMHLQQGQQQQQQPQQPPQQQQQQTYQQMANQQGQQMAFRGPVQQQQMASGPRQQFAQQSVQQQQVQYQIRQRWPVPQNGPVDQFSGKPHGQFMQMPGGQRQLVPQQAGVPLGPQQVPPQLTPQQQQLWLQQRQQAQRYALAPRLPMNGPIPPQQQHQQPPQSPMHPSMGGMPGMPHDPTKVRMNTNTNMGTESVSTSITAVVGGGADTVIATSGAPGVTNAMVTNQQVQHMQGQQAINSSVSNHSNIAPPPSQAIMATKTILVSTQAPTQVGLNQQQQQQQQAQTQQQQQGYQISAGSVNSSSSNSPSSNSVPTAPSTSVVNEKTKTALANLLNNRLNQQNGQQQQQHQHLPNLILARANTSATVSSESRDHANAAASSSGKAPLLGSIVVSQQQQQQQTHQQGGKPSPSSVVGVRPQQPRLMTTGSGGPTASPATTMTQQVSALAQQQQSSGELQMSSVASHAVEMANHAPHTPHALPSPQTPHPPVPSPLAAGAPFAGAYPPGGHQQPPQSPLVPHMPPLNGHSPLAHMPHHSQVAGPLQRVPMPAGPHHPMHHPAFGPHPHPHMTPGSHPPHPHAVAQQSPQVQTPMQGIPPPVGSQVAPPQVAAPPGMPTIIQIRFFGHESRQMIPPEFCLIGCVFYIAPSYTENPATARLVPGWKRKIEKYGGRVVDQYLSGPSNTVTHVVTEHTQGSLQKLALQENKRCVSIFWLDDVLANKRLLPPWRFYHLPVAYNQNKPCSSHIIAITNFEGEERDKLVQLIKRTGAKYTSYLTSKNTVLICKRLEGEKYEKAVQWRIAIVNLQWLQDILFGHFEALQLSNLHKKYQTFDNYQNSSNVSVPQNITPSQMLQREVFKVDYSVVHVLMAPWRTPIKFDSDALNEKMKELEDQEKQNDNSANQPDNAVKTSNAGHQSTESDAKQSNNEDSKVKLNPEQTDVRVEQNGPTEPKEGERAPKRSFDTMSSNDDLNGEERRSNSDDKGEEKEVNDLEPVMKKQKLDTELSTESEHSNQSTEQGNSTNQTEQTGDAQVVPANPPTESTPMEVDNEQQQSSKSDAEIKVESSEPPLPPTNADEPKASATTEPVDLESPKNVSEATVEKQSAVPPVDEVSEPAISNESASATIKLGSETGEDRLENIPVMVAELTESCNSELNSQEAPGGDFKVPDIVPVAPAAPPTQSTKTVDVLFTGVESKYREELRVQVETLGGRVVLTGSECTHLIADRIVPTMKFFCAFARAQFVLRSEWLRESARVGHFVDEADYWLSDAQSEQLYQVDLARSRERRNRDLFKNMVFLLTRSCVPSPTILQQIIESNGGVAVIKRPPTKQQLKSMQDRKLTFVVVTCETDLHLCDRFFDNKTKVVSVEFVMNAILRQQLDYESHSYPLRRNGHTSHTITASMINKSMSMNFNQSQPQQQQPQLHSQSQQQPQSSQQASMNGLSHQLPTAAAVAPPPPQASLSVGP